MLVDSTHRRWAIAFLVLLILATAAYIPYHARALNGPRGGTLEGLTYGTVGFLLMLYAGLLGARRKVPMWRVGRASTWMKGHLWLGLLSFPLIVFHGGFQLGGPLTTVLMVLFTIVLASGVLGVVLQQVLPRKMLAQVPVETVYEEIPAIVAQLRMEADQLVAEVCGRTVETGAASAEPRGGGGLAAGEVLARPTPRPRPTTATPLPESALLEKFYDAEIRLWLDPKASRRARLAAGRADALFQHLRTILPPDLYETVGELEAICTERRQLADQERLHVLLHGWLLVHAPASMALLLLSGAHAVMALRY